MSNQITFKTQIRIDCQGWEGRCLEKVWVNGHVTLEKTIDISPGELDVEYGMNISSCHTSEIELPDTWFTFADGYLCRVCYKKYDKYCRDSRGRRK